LASLCGNAAVDAVDVMYGKTQLPWLVLFAQWLPGALIKNKRRAWAERSGLRPGRAAMLAHSAEKGLRRSAT